MNGDRIGTGWVEEANTFANQRSPLTLQSTLNLNSNDQVWVAISDQFPETFLWDRSGSGYHYTHFTGWMLEEEIAASL